MGIYLNNPYFDEDIRNIVNDKTIDIRGLDGSSIFITGATGLIGTLLVSTLIEAQRALNIKFNLTVLTRNAGRIKERFSGEEIEIIEGDIKDFQFPNKSLDHIIHAAGETKSKAFIEKPVEVMKTVASGTERVLALAKEKNVKSMIFLSTMEVYGTPETDEKITEEHPLCTDSSSVRNSYPIGKIAAENLCIAYQKEYQVPICILRLTQTFGPGVSEDDERVFAEMMRCAKADCDIILKTEGKTKRCYLYTADAVRAILLSIKNSEMHNGGIFNVANEETYCSIKEMAETALLAMGCKNAKIRIELSEDSSGLGYAPTLCMNLDTKKIRKYGFKPSYGLKEMFQRMAGV